MSLCLQLMGQGSDHAYVRARILLTPENARALPLTGIDVEHGLLVPNRYFESDFATWEVERVRAHGYEVEILIEDVVEFYRTRQAQRSPLVCQQFDYPYPVPDNFALGSMGGFLTYQEMLDQLDLMAHAYPELISVRSPVGTEVTHQGRSLQWVRISDNPGVDEDEPEILYTGLHHAREPMSMMQMIYFMWYLLEQYDQDPEIKYLINNTELYFVPCVNPDGYLYNQQVAPEGGGMWRKNMRDNNDNGVFEEEEDGVDLNRNYAFQWGLDEEGSSAHPGSIVYRGPEPFSEPESRALRDFVAGHDFLLALNYHSFGNFLIYPWGFDGSVNPDSVLFQNYGELLSRENGYEAGTAQQTLGYLVNGVATDWMYAEHDIIALTPEIGDEEVGFWPAQDQIIPLCQASMQKNLSLAHLTQDFAVATDINADFLTTREGELQIAIKRYGMGEGSLALTVESLSPELEIQGILQEVGFNLFDEEVYTYQYSLSGAAVPGQAYGMVVKIDNGFFESRDTIHKVFSGLIVPFLENGDDIDAWITETGASWGSTDEEAYSGTTSLTDSPYGAYSKSQTTHLTLLEPVNLRDAFHAELAFAAKWEIEEIIDYALVQISTDGENFQNLCGQYSEPGSIFQLTGEPVYHGIQEEWVQERIDLSDYLGEDVYVRFVMVSDGFFEMDGIYLDDITIKVYAEELTSVKPLPKDAFSIRQFPNPSAAFVYLDIDLHEVGAQQAVIAISDPLGHVLDQRHLNPGVRQRVSFDLRSYPPGLYTTTLFVDGRPVQSKRVVRVR
ncbi:MAG: M14 family zinc carboxypeptidase [Saprospiraceae bacterium]|nr:M14 family zinc carboxypeptidase [Saprospiraceae bacterium]